MEGLLSNYDKIIKRELMSLEDGLDNVKIEQPVLGKNCRRHGDNAILLEISSTRVKQESSSIFKPQVRKEDTISLLSSDEEEKQEHQQACDYFITPLGSYNIQRLSYLEDDLKLERVGEQAAFQLDAYLYLVGGKNIVYENALIRKD